MAYYIVNCDGKKEPNSDEGIASWGFIIHDDTGMRTYSRYGSLGRGYSHNFAEYFALYEALKFIRIFTDKTFQIRTDSKLAVDQLTGAAVCKADTLVNVYHACLSMMDAYDRENRPKLSWIPREKNVAADALTRKAHEYFKKANHVSSLALEAWYVKPWRLVPE